MFDALVNIPVEKWDAPTWRKLFRLHKDGRLFGQLDNVVAAEVERRQWRAALRAEKRAQRMEG